MRFSDFLLTKMILASIFAVWCIVFYWLFWPYTPATVQEPIKILNKDRIVKAGGYLVYELTIDKKMALPATIHKQLINDFVITYSPIIGNISTGTRDMKVKLKIPKSASPGCYIFKWEGIYKVNPMRDVSIIAQSEQFEVVE